MKKQSSRKTAPVALLKGTTLVDSPRASQPGTGRLSFIDSPEYGAGYLVVGDDVLVGMQKTFLDNLQEHNVVALEDGTFRVDLRETRIGLRLTRDELDFLLSRRQAEGFRIDSAFEGAAPAGSAKPAAATSAKGTTAKAAKTGSKAAPKAKQAASAKPVAAKPVAARGAKSPAKAAAQPKAAEQTPQAEAVQPTAAKGRKGAKAVAQAAPKATGKTAPKATGKGAGKGAAKTAAPAAQQAPKAAEPVSLDAHRKRKQGASGQAELPGLTEPLRKAARSAALDKSIREPRASAGKPATAKAGTAKAAPGGRRKGGATAATAPTGASARGKTARSNARTQVTGTATTAKGRGKAEASTAQATQQGGTATSAQVKDAARAVISEMKRPVPRQELLKLVQERLGASVPGKSPVDNMVTILYKDPDGGFENVKSRGFWLKGQDLPAA